MKRRLRGQRGNHAERKSKLWGNKQDVLDQGVKGVGLLSRIAMSNSKPLGRPVVPAESVV